MTHVPQRELRNNIGEVLRRAERGERLTVTVGGRPVAELGPLRAARGFASAEILTTLLTAHPVDQAWEDEIAAERAVDRERHPDPWRPADGA